MAIRNCLFSPNSENPYWFSFGVTCKVLNHATTHTSRDRFTTKPKWASPETLGVLISVWLF